jgi:hypothetical protein
MTWHTYDPGLAPFIFPIAYIAMVESDTGATMLAAWDGSSFQPADGAGNPEVVRYRAATAQEEADYEDDVAERIAAELEGAA